MKIVFISLEKYYDGPISITQIIYFLGLDHNPLYPGETFHCLRREERLCNLYTRHDHFPHWWCWVKSSKLDGSDDDDSPETPTSLRLFFIFDETILEDWQAPPIRRRGCGGSRSWVVLAVYSFMLSSLHERDFKHRSRLRWSV